MEIGFLFKQLPLLLTQDGLRFLLTNPRVKTILLMIIYTLSPFDLLPEAILGPIGLLDDSAVVLNIMRQFGGLVVDFIRQEAPRDRERQRMYDNHQRQPQHHQPRRNYQANPYPEL